MAYNKSYKKGGSGGKLGHSNMSHWEYTEVIKAHSKKARRLEERGLVKHSEATELVSAIPRQYSRKKKKRVTKIRQAASKNYMSKRRVNILKNILSKEKNRFYYFKDYYAFLLLSYFIEDGMTIGKIKQTNFARLLTKPAIKQIVAELGGGKLSQELLFSKLPAVQECYLLTLGKWGKDRDRWFNLFNQTSRPGMNLVLQLNFSNKHNKPYYKLIKPRDSHPFQVDLHPIAKKGYHTLAWSRLDIADDCSYALIEEIQNDWIRLATLGKTTTETIREDDERAEQVIQQYFHGADVNRSSVQKYVDEVLRPHIGIWDEAVLGATIWFLKEKIGVSRIFYHTFQTGNLLKGLSGIKKPPRSIYSELPRRFCFTETEEIPAFLENRIKEIKTQNRNARIRFYVLDIC